MAEPERSNIPVYQAYMNPILVALRGMGGQATVRDLEARVFKDMRLPAAQLAIPHKDEQPQGKSEAAYRMAWSRTYLRKAGLLTTPARGVWALTEKGLEAGVVDEMELARRIGDSYKDDSEDPDEEPEERNALEPQLVAELKALYSRLVANGTALAPEALAKCYRLFRERFGPEVLAGLDGERLLTTIHGRGTRDSLVYWLEFKDDDEFPAKFGSIAGGSALKFGIYQSAESGQWMTGPPMAQERLTLDAAIERVRSQRQQLVAGAKVLDDFVRGGDRNYSDLQRQMVAAAPDLAETAWGHKYFALVHPSVVDDFHALEYQQYHIVKILRIPTEGRYANAGILVRAAQELGIDASTLGTILNYRDGSPHAYWRVGTTVADASEWSRMKNGNFIGIGWLELGDLSTVQADSAGKERVRSAMEAKFPAQQNVVSRKANEVFKFVTSAKERDLVLAMDGITVLGIGRLVGDYYFKNNDGPLAHRRGVEWLKLDEWRLPEAEGIRTTFVRLGKHFKNLVQAESNLISAATPTPLRPKVTLVTEVVRPPAVLSGILGRIQSVLQRKRQVILHGPPGTGKTYWASQGVIELAARSWFNKTAAHLTDVERAQLLEHGATVNCVFHPSYGYEDFLEGYRPYEAEGRLVFRKKDGLFKLLCERARNDPSKRSYFLLIDEVNRGDAPRIFGELLMVLEKDKRGQPVTLPLSGETLVVSDNLFIVATMNTADRSIALLDAALRRRFGFIELMPDSTALQGVSVKGLPLGAWLDELNRRIVANVGRDARNLQIGHAYLMAGERPVQDVARFAEILRDDVVPLLEEYCYENYEALAQILGSSLVQRERQRVDQSLFAPERHDELMGAMTSAFAAILTTSEAVAATASASEIADAAEDEDSDAAP